nr:MAG TPA: hypothetical protein [Caudoviricetes sp.]
MSEKKLDLEKSRKQSSKAPEQEQEIDGLYIASLWKWQCQDKNKNRRFTVSLKRIGAKSIYLRHKKVFDKLAILSLKKDLPIDSYISFFAKELDGGNHEEFLDSNLVSTTSFSAFADYIQKRDKQKKIYKWFMKSVNNIVEECVDNNWFTTKDFLRNLIDQNKLGNWYVSGKISKYYLAAIPNFWKIVPQLDHFSKLELDQVASRYDIYNREINETFLKLKNFKVNPIAMTDTLIYERRHGI